jgi:hypothetical protein
MGNSSSARYHKLARALARPLPTLLTSAQLHLPARTCLLCFWHLFDSFLHFHTHRSHILNHAGTSEEGVE